MAPLGFNLIIPAFEEYLQKFLSTPQSLWQKGYFFHSKVYEKILQTQWHFEA